MGFQHWFRDAYENLRSDPSWGTFEIALRKLWAGALGRLFQPWKLGKPIWELDFDVLVILDGCRVDALREVAATEALEWLGDGDGIEEMWSVGSTSREWLQNTFRPRYRDRMGRTAYITGNPYTPSVDGEAFKLLVHLDLGEVHGIQTVPPRALTDVCIDISRRRAELDIDQLIVHYMQPHTPFRSKPSWFEAFDGTGKFGSEIWWRLADGSLAADEYWEAYLDNLKWVLEEITLLEDCIDGRIVVTADHGNAMGEWGLYGHPKGVPLPAVRKVPKVVIHGSDSGGYRPEHTVSTVDTVDSDRDVERQLRALGYA